MLRLLIGGLASLLLMAGCRSKHDSQSTAVPVYPLGIISTANDNVLFMGDSITLRAFNREDAKLPGYYEVMQMLHPGRGPGYVDAAIGGTTSVDGLGIIDGLLAQYPWVNYVTLAYGTNDTNPLNNSSLDLFRSSMTTMVQKVQAAGKIPVIPTIPFSLNPQWSGQPAFNAIIADINTTYNLTPGPDLYTWFFNRQDELQPDGIHPTDQGSRDMNILWAVTIGAMY